MEAADDWQSNKNDPTAAERLTSATIFCRSLGALLAYCGRFTRWVAGLGYPPYFLKVVGVGQLLCALAILCPGFQRAKEWAYAGVLLNYCAAAYSHFAVGDPVGGWVPPLVFAALTFASWALRLPDRRLAASSEPASKRTWAIALGVLVLMTLVALLTLPNPSRR